MRILKVFDGDYPWDVRVEKTLATLSAAGHEVHLLCRNQEDRPRHERLEDGTLAVRLPATRPDALSMPLPMNPLWAIALRRELRRFRPDRLLVRDLALAPIGVVLARRFRVPVVVDLAEPYPDSLRSQEQFGDVKGLARLLRNPRAAEWAESFVLRRAQRVLVVCPEAGARLERRGLPAGRWTEVGNTPRLGSFAASGETSPHWEGFEEAFRLVFVGLLSGDRGVEVALDAVQRLRRTGGRRVGLLVVGNGAAHPRLVQRADELGLEDHVRFTGFLAHSELPDILAGAHVGLLPFHRCPHIESTLANKLFEYMAARVPVVCSDVAPMLRILDETEAGISFRAGDAESLAAAIEKLAVDADLRTRLGAAGRKAAEDRYHWGVDGRRLLEAVESP